MAGYSARQSSFTTGDTILAAHSNDEFNQVLAAFHATTGHSHDGTAGEGGPISTLRDADSLNKILVDTSNNHLEFYVEVSSAAVQQLRIQDGAIVPITDNDIDLGTSSLEFKDAFFDGTITTDALVADTADLNGGSVDGATLGTNSAITQAVIDNININGATIGHTDDTDLLTLADGVLTVAGEVSMTTLDIGGTNITATAAELNILDGVTSTASELNLVDGITAGTVSASKAVIVDSNKDLTGFRNLTISGDLTVSGDDITMGTNTAGNLLIADGTNFNSIAVGSLSEISTVADDDVFLAVDTSGGGLKKIARSAVVSGLATSSAISNVADDSTPQLGGNLDMNGNDIVTTSNADIELAPNGTGHVTIKGNTNQGTIQFNCENNSHGQQVKAAPHSESASNVLTLPSTGGDARLVSTASTATLTNKTLTSPKINEDVAVTSTATELNLLDGVTATTTELNLIDGGSSIGTDAIADGDGIIHNDGGTMKVTSAATFKTYFTSGVSSAADDITAGDAAITIATTSGNITIDAQAGDSDIIFKGTDSSADITALTLDMSDAGTAVFNHDIKIADDGQVGSASAADAMIISSGGIVTFKDDILIKDGGTIGVASTADAITVSSAGIVTFKDDILIKDGGTIGAASDADSITIASDGVVTFSQAPVFPDGSIAVVDLDIDGATDIGEDIVDADLFIVDNGAGGTNRKVAASRIKTYIGGGTQWQSVKTSNFTASAGQGVFCNTTSGAFTLTLPASPSIGDEVSFVDYAGTFDTNNLTIGRNSSKIHGAEEDLTVSVERAANTLVFTDSTQGWLLKSK